MAAVALTRDGHAGRVYPLTGPEVLTPRDEIRQLSAATGRALSFVELTPEETRRERVARGRLPDLLLFRALDAEPALGHPVTGVVEEVTGRPARTFARWAAEHTTQ